MRKWTDVACSYHLLAGNSNLYGKLANHSALKSTIWVFLNFIWWPTAILRGKKCFKWFVFKGWRFPGATVDQSLLKQVFLDMNHDKLLFIFFHCSPDSQQNRISQPDRIHEFMISGFFERDPKMDGSVRGRNRFHQFLIEKEHSLTLGT